MKLPEAIQLPKEIAVIYYQKHQMGTYDIIIGNKFTEHTAITAGTTKSPTLGALILSIHFNNLLLQYIQEEIDWATNMNIPKI